MTASTSILAAMRQKSLAKPVSGFVFGRPMPRACR